MIHAWPIRILHFPAHGDWFRDGHVTQVKLMNVTLSFAGAMAEEVLSVCWDCMQSYIWNF